MRISKERFKAILEELGCENRLSEIFLYAENPANLGKEERQSLERHFRACHHCQAELDFASKHLRETAGEELPQWVTDLSQSFQNAYGSQECSEAHEGESDTAPAGVPQFHKKGLQSLLDSLRGYTMGPVISKFVEQGCIVRVFRKALSEPLASEEERMERLASAACFGPFSAESQRMEVLLKVWEWLGSLDHAPSRTHGCLRALHQWAAGKLTDAETLNHIERATERRLAKAASQAPLFVPETASALWTAVQWLEAAPVQADAPAPCTSWISRAWRPLFAGQAVTAGDISEQSHRFKGPEGIIEVSCRWQGPKGERLAHIRIAWRANMRTRHKLYVRFCHVKTHETLSEICLGANLEGETTLNEKKLGFDPSTVPWNLSLLLK
jgi:hypothetical protein